MPTVDINESKASCAAVGDALGDASPAEAGLARFAPFGAIGLELETAAVKRTYKSVHLLATLSGLTADYSERVNRYSVLLAELIRC